jgi:hypothetical protein
MCEAPHAVLRSSYGYSSDFLDRCRNIEAFDSGPKTWFYQEAKPIGTLSLYFAGAIATELSHEVAGRENKASFIVAGTTNGAANAISITPSSRR